MKIIFEIFWIFFGVLGKHDNSDEAKQLISKFQLVLDREDTYSYFESEKEGVALRSDNGVINTVFLYSEGKDGFSQYNGPMVDGLNFSSTRADIEKILGEPDVKGDAGGESICKHGGWYKYNFDDCSIHFSFDQDSGRVELITLMTV